ncbi:hypothetical protein [Oceanobacillus sp. FSL K6-0251]|uniref:hypothetical protein n=1 Tax=Oceanobacillus sp. FSL K6-0251 TaxID=2921602 RepID=UPI0030F5DCF2
MNFHEMQTSMKKAVSLAKSFEGDWQARMKLAFKTLKVEHYMQQPIKKDVIEMLLLHGVSYRRISKNYDKSRSEINEIMAFENI